MKAAVLYEVGRPLVIEDVVVSDPGPHEVLVRMAAAGVCQSDLAVAEGRLPAAIPAVMGHEGAGVVEEIGPGVTSVRPGDHVLMLWRAGCGQCYYCAHGSPAICDLGFKMRSTGLMSDGTSRYKVRGTSVHHFNAVSTFAEYSLAPAVSVMKVDPTFALDRVAVVGCAVLTGVGAVFNASDVGPGSRVLVIGCGGVGLNVIQGSVLAGAEMVIAVDTLEPKRKFARQFGATHVIDPSGISVAEAVAELTDGVGVDDAFEAVGRVATIEDAIRATRRGGTIVCIGMPPPGTKLPVEPLAMIMQNKTLRGSIYGSCDFRVDVPRILGLYRAGKLKLDELITGTYPLTKINDALAALHGGAVARSVINLQNAPAIVPTQTKQGSDAKGDRAASSR